MRSGRRSRRRPVDIDKPCTLGNDYRGRHVVAWINREIIVDSTLYQASSPDHGIEITPRLIVIPFPRRTPKNDLPHIKAVYKLDDEKTEILVEWVGTHDCDWEHTPSWDSSHLTGLIKRIVKDIEERL